MATEKTTFVLAARDTGGREWELRMPATVEFEDEVVEGDTVRTVTSIVFEGGPVTGRITAE